MKNRILTAAAVAAASAGVSHAQLSYQGANQPNERLEQFAGFVQDGQPAQLVSTVFEATDLYTLGRSVFEFSPTFDTSSAPQIEAFELDSRVITETSSDRFEVTWDATYSGRVSSLDGLILAHDPIEFDTNLLVVVDTDTRLRISWESDTRGPLGDGSLDQNFAELSIGGGPLSGFNFGYGSSGFNEGNFSFEIDVAAGDELVFDLEVESYYNTNSDTSVLEWDRRSFGSFVIEVIPAPSTAALLGLGGLVAARRRR